MKNKMGFYVTVTTSESVKCANGECRYVVQLPKRLTITNNVKVGIVEISYPNCIKTFQFDEECKVEISFYNTKQQLEEHEIDLPLKSYLSVKYLVELLNDYVSDITSAVKITYIQEDNIVKIEATNAKIKFSSKLKDIFGLNTCSIENETVFSKQRANIQANREFLNICSNIVQPDYIQSQWRSVLRRILHTTTNETYIQHTFIPIYHSISKTDFDTIEIKVCDDNGIPIVFEKGTLHMLLHFNELQ